MSARPIPRRTPMTKPAVNDPGIDQGRNSHHNPERDRDILRTLILFLASWSVFGAVCWMVFIR